MWNRVLPFISPILGWAFFYIPAAVIAAAPVLKWMKLPPHRWMPPFFSILTAVCIVGGIREAYYPSAISSYADIPVVIILVVIYIWLVKLDGWKLWYLLVNVAAILSFGGILTKVLDARAYPHGTIGDDTFFGTLAQALINTLFTILFLTVSRKKLRWILENLQDKVTWRWIWMIPGLMLGMNLMMVPHYNSTISVNRVFPVALVVITVQLILYFLFQFLFYQIARSMVTRYELEYEKASHDMQMEQYRNLQQYMEETARMRHDFQHVIYTIQELSTHGEYQRLDRYLEDFKSNYHYEKKVEHYCSNAAIDALVGHYAGIAHEEGIETFLSVEIEELGEIREADLSIVIGNLLNNAIAACKKLPKENRFIRLSVDSSEQNQLYLTMVNSCAETDSPENRTKQEGGYGLPSIRAIAKKYNGQTSFLRKENRFLSNVMMSKEI